MFTEKIAIELKSLLTSWKLEKLYETLKNEEIFLEELEMMTVDHLEAIMKNEKMGVRIKFEYHFKKWRTTIGAPLDKGISQQCCSFRQHNNNAIKNATKVAEKETQTESDRKITCVASTQTSEHTNSIKRESNAVKVVLRTSQIREVLDKIKENNANTRRQGITTFNEPANEVAAISNATLVEQPSTTTFHDTLQLPSNLSSVSEQTNETHSMQILESYTATSKTLPIEMQVKNVITTKYCSKLSNPEPLAVSNCTPPLKLHAHRASPYSTSAALRTPPKLPPTTFMRTTTDISPNGETTKKPLIPKASLKRHLPRTKTDESTVPVSTFVLSNLSIIKKLGTKGLLHQSKYEKVAKNFVLDILISESNQGLQLLQKYEQNQVFSAEERENLIQIICEYYHKREMNFSVHINDKLVEQILEIFPNEQLNSYRKGICGKIYKQYYAMRPHFVNTTETHTLNDSNDSDSFMEEINSIFSRKDANGENSNDGPIDSSFDNIKIECLSE